MAGDQSRGKNRLSVIGRSEMRLGLPVRPFEFLSHIPFEGAMQVSLFGLQGRKIPNASIELKQFVNAGGKFRLGILPVIRFNSAQRVLSLPYKMKVTVDGKEHILEPEYLHNPSFDSEVRIGFTLNEEGRRSSGIYRRPLSIPNENSLEKIRDATFELVAA